MSAVVLDTGPIVLFVVGLTKREAIKAHKKLDGYGVADYMILTDFLKLFTEFVLLPHVLAEVSSLSRFICEPYRTQIQVRFREFVDLNGELPLPSINGMRRDQFFRLGMTDAVILNALELLNARTDCALLTIDSELASEAASLGYSAFTLKDLKS